MTMYLGPLGDLRKIHPLTDIDTTSKRYGGKHTALSGRKTLDYTGNRAEFKLEWKHRDENDMQFLEALHHRHIKGPLRLVLDGMKRNRLSRSAASTGYGRTKAIEGVEKSSGSFDSSSKWPDDDVSMKGKSLLWSGWGTDDELRFDRNDPVPIADGETLTASVYVRSAYADSVRLVLDHYTDDEEFQQCAGLSG